MENHKDYVPDDFYPEPIPLTSEERAAAIAKVKAAFSAADLQRYTEIEEGIPAEDILKDLEEIHRKANENKP